MKNTIRKTTKKSILLYCILALFSCKTYQVVDYSIDQQTDFTKYKTFAWLPDSTDSSDQLQINEVVRNNIRNYFGQNFAKRGYRSELDSPDLLMQVLIRNELQQNEYTVVTHPWPYYYRPYFYGSVYYHPYPVHYYYRRRVYMHPPPPTIITNTTVEYYESSITLNIYDRKLNKMIWTATVQGDIYDPAYFNRNIHPAVESIMDKYPIPPLNSNSNGNDNLYR